MYAKTAYKVVIRWGKGQGHVFHALLADAVPNQRTLLKLLERRKAEAERELNGPERATEMKKCDDLAEIVRLTTFPSEEELLEFEATAFGEPNAISVELSVATVKVAVTTIIANRCYHAS